MIEPIALLSLFKSIGEWILRFFDRKRQRSREKEQEERAAPARNMVGRFLQIYSAHDIERTQIPRVLTPYVELRLGDVLDDHKLLACMDERVIQFTCDRFNINRAWLEGEEGQSVHPRLHIYKSLGHLVELMIECRARKARLTAYVIKSPGNELSAEDDREDMAIVIEEGIGSIGDKAIYRYYVVNETWPWAHEPARIQFKAALWILEKFDAWPIGGELPQKDIEAILDGEVFPSKFLKYRPGRLWHPDDYIAADFPATKEVEEVEVVMNYLKGHGLHDWVLRQISDVAKD